MSHYRAVRMAAALAVPMTFGAWTVQAADIIDTAEQAGRFNAFLQLLEAAGMIDTLKGEGPFTIFAPTDEAVGQLPLGMLDQLLAAENRKPLEVIIQSHIVADAAIGVGEFLGRAVEVATLGGGALAIDGTTAVIMVAPIEVTIKEVGGPAEQTSEPMLLSAIVVDVPRDSIAGADRHATRAEHELTAVAMVVVPDIEADNGVIHGIDSVLLPAEVRWSF